MSKKSKILDTVLETAKGLHDIGVIDGITMREFEAFTFKPVPQFSAQDIKSIRLRAKVSQPVLAQLMNVSPSTVKKWETGENHPAGPALRLLNLIQDNGINIFQ